MQLLVLAYVYKNVVDMTSISFHLSIQALKK
jgi:hypothetical protein